MNHRIALNLGLMLLLLLACGETKKTPAISGTISVCNNHNCGEILDGNLEVTFEKYPLDSHLSSTLADVMEKYERRDRVKDKIKAWIDRIIYQNEEGRIHYLHLSTSIFINGELVIDTSKLCQECTRLYEKYNLPLNTPPKVVNLVQAGFRTELQVKNALAREFGYSSYATINEYTDKGKSVKYACDDASESLLTRGLTFEEAVQWARNSFKWMFDTYTGVSKLRQKAPKDPDKMTDAEWYDYMESLSNDPAWKETVRKHRQAKGIK
jgi:hypothetical protein